MIMAHADLVRIAFSELFCLQLVEAHVASVRMETCVRPLNVLDRLRGVAVVDKEMKSPRGPSPVPAKTVLPTLRRAKDIREERGVDEAASGVDVLEPRNLRRRLATDA
jgi:hypothetical protein